MKHLTIIGSACAVILATASACVAVEATHPALPVKIEFVGAKMVQYTARLYGADAYGRPRTLGRRYGLRMSVRLSNASSEALRSITLEGVYVDREGNAVRKMRRQLTIAPPLQPGQARVIEFEQDFGAKPPAVQGFAGKVVDMNFAPETLTIARDGKLHAEPRPDARVELALRRGTKVQRLNWWRDWCQVKAPTGEIGWIHASLLPLAIFVDGQQLPLEVQPTERPDGSITVLLVPLAKALGAEVKWQPESSSILVVRDQTQLLLKQGSAEAIVTRPDREPITLHLPEPLQVKRGKSFIDLHWLCRRFGATVTYDPVTRSVNIESHPAPPAPGAIRQARGASPRPQC